MRDLLAYSKLGRTHPRAEPIDLDDVFGNVFNQGGGGRTSYSTQQGPPAGFEDILGGMFGNAGGGRFGQPSGGFRGFGGPQKGADVTASTDSPARRWRRTAREIRN